MGGRERAAKPSQTKAQGRSGADLCPQCPGGHKHQPLGFSKKLARNNAHLTKPAVIRGATPDGGASEGQTARINKLLVINTL